MFDIASHLVAAPAFLAAGSTWLIGIGIAGAVAAALVGLLDLLAIATGTVAFRTGLVHMGLNLVVTAAYGVGFVWRQHLDPAAGPVAAGPLLLSVAGSAVLGLSGSLGAGWPTGTGCASWTRPSRPRASRSRPTQAPPAGPSESASPGPRQVRSRSPHQLLEVDMAVAALVAWVLTALGRFVMLVRWISSGGLRQQHDGATHFPAGLVFGHFGLAAAGLVLWIAYLLLHIAPLAWAAFVVLLPVALLGFAMFARWTAGRRSTVGVGSSGTTSRGSGRPAEQTLPVAVVAAHGVFAVATVVLVLLAALSA